ncbi:hypothetical protein MP638_005616 [Amoeboaphelidium occidentale]|nr:hypothetical protein MP638_005616 [Amoeboaphelidium occidentale]
MSLQDAEYVELLSPQGSKPLAEWAEVSNNKRSRPVTREYDRSAKGLCFVLNGRTLNFPSTKNSDLYHPVIVLQVYLDLNCIMSIEIIASASSTTVSHKFRNKSSMLTRDTKIVFSSVVKSKKSDPLHVTLPLDVKRGRWNNVVIDMEAVLMGTCDLKLKKIHKLSITGSCRVRKVFALKRHLTSLKNTTKDIKFPRDLDFSYACEHGNLKVECFGDQIKWSRYRGLLKSDDDLTWAEEANPEQEFKLSTPQKKQPPETGCSDRGPKAESDFFEMEPQKVAFKSPKGNYNPSRYYSIETKSLKPTKLHETINNPPRISNRDLELINLLQETSLIISKAYANLS